MKRYGIIALALALSCALLTGCRSRNNMMDPVSPTNQTSPQSPATMPATRPSEPMVTEPATQDMTEGSTNETATDSAENSTEDTVPRSRGMAR